MSVTPVALGLTTDYYITAPCVEKVRRMGSTGLTGVRV